ncbi:hypothetical protein BIW11_02963 [Tropilaelaps mercedesae]|uniref:Cuticle protein 10.9-like n=1 Tax=Tropilaelaps mercedesae TaxID=418985 RepID=A0A1V9XUD3_9ACAR|nr:hypothetical protein BIW11_02963 [Tropilaelaps mercedesae]
MALAAAHAGGHLAATAYGLAGYNIAASSHGYRHVTSLAHGTAAPVIRLTATPIPYQFGYESVDEYGTKQSRHEVSDVHNNKKGCYSFPNAGGVARRVEYVADKLGFRASIKTNEPDTASSAPASAHYLSSPITVKTIAIAPVTAKAIAAAPVAAYAHAPFHKHY